MDFTDPTAVTCDQIEELLSAQVDGETTAADDELVEHHLANCAACTTLAAQIGVLSRQLRFRSADPVPNLVNLIADRTRPAVLGRGGWLRPAMAWVAVVLFAQNVMALLAGHMEGADGHLARHIGAFGVALSIGFAYVAWKPHRSHGLLPFATALIGTMTVSAVADIVAGGRSPVAESAHFTEIIGLGLLWMIAGSPGWTRWSERRHHPLV